MKTQLQKCLAALEDLCECSKGICLPAEIDFTIETLRETLAKTDAPTSWVEMVAVNLVREGVNKHKARELAQHFHSLIQKDDVEPVAWMRPSKEGYDSAFRDASTVALCRSTERGGWSHWDEWVPLFTHPAPKPMTDFDIRGKLSTLKCWHRLTGDEIQDLIEFAQKQQAK